MEKVEAEKLIGLTRYISEVVSSPADLQKTFETTVNMLRSVLNAECCSLMLLDEDKGVLRMAASSDIDRTIWSTIEASLGEGFAGKVAETGKPLLVREAKEGAAQTEDQRQRYTSRSFICAPMKSKGRTLGVINITNRRSGDAFTTEHVDMVAALANLVALSLENANLLMDADAMRRRLHNVLEGIGDGVIAVNKEGEILHHNEIAVHYLGHRGGNWAGRILTDAVPEELRTVFEDLLSRTMEERHHIHEDVEWSSGPRGKKTPLTLSTTPLCSRQSGAPTGAVFVLHDMTLHHKVDELRKIDEAKNSFLAIISHELRTPLTSIKGATHLLRGRIAGQLSPEDLQLLKIIEQNSERLLQQIINVLDVANIQTQATSLTLRNVRISEVVERCLDSVREEAEKKEIELTASCTVEPDVLMVDEEKVSRAVIHLLDNAVKFTPRGGCVTVSTYQTDGEMIIAVRDTGGGIDPTLRDRIFHKFVQGEGPLTRQSGGCGIGLFVARAFAELHGGRIVTRNIPGGGCEFQLVLPAASLTDAFSQKQTNTMSSPNAIGSP